MARQEVIRSLYRIPDPDLAAEFVTQLASDLQDDSCPPEVNDLILPPTDGASQRVAIVVDAHAAVPPDAHDEIDRSRSDRPGRRGGPDHK